MATTNATITLQSSGIGSQPLSLSKSMTLYKLGTTTGLDQTTGLSRLITEATTNVILLDTVAGPRAALGSKNGKVYIKNCSTTDTEYIVITINATIMGRLYAGDFAFFPWSAVGGTKEAFTATFANTWAAGDTFTFDGVTVIAGGSGLNENAAAVDATQIPNWTTSVASAVVTFTSRHSRADLEIDSTEAVVVTAGDGTAAIATTVEGTKSSSDIYIKPSVETGITVESMLFYQ